MEDLFNRELKITDIALLEEKIRLLKNESIKNNKNIITKEIKEILPKLNKKLKEISSKINKEVCFSVKVNLTNSVINDININSLEKLFGSYEWNRGTIYNYHLINLDIKTEILDKNKFNSEDISLINEIIINDIDNYFNALSKEILNELKEVEEEINQIFSKMKKYQININDLYENKINK